MLVFFTLNAILFFLFANYSWLVNIERIGAQSQSISNLCAGGTHACAVLGTQKVKCMGKADYWGSSFSNMGDSLNELGNGLPYINFGTSVSITKVSCGFSFICAVLATQDIKCLGSNTHGQIGIGSTKPRIGFMSGDIGDGLAIVNLGTGLKIIDVALGASHVCAIVTGNIVKCYGANYFGQLGIGTTDSIGQSISQMGNSLAAIDLGTNFMASSIFSGSSTDHNCAILSAPASSAQRVKCWGYNNNFQLGYGNQNNRGDEVGEMGSNLPLVDLGTESKVKSLALGAKYTCALLINDIFKCWGYGSDGQLASGSTIAISSTGNSLPIVSVDTGKTVKLISAGNSHTCIVYNDDLTLKCFGDNSAGQLGQGDVNDRGNNPTTMISAIPAIDVGSGSTKISSVYSGGEFNCILFADASLRCFGENSFGQLAIGTNVNIGDNPSEMGTNLKASNLAGSETSSPTAAPNNACSGKSKKKCVKNSQCVWTLVGSKEQCTLFTCQVYTDKPACRADTRCAWKSGKCQSP